MAQAGSAAAMGRVVAAIYQEASAVTVSSMSASAIVTVVYAYHHATRHELVARSSLEGTPSEAKKVHAAPGTPCTAFMLASRAVESAFASAIQEAGAAGVAPV